MNIVFRCADPALAPSPLEGSAHFCGILYLFEIPSVWSCSTDMGKRAQEPFSIPFSWCRLELTGLLVCFWRLKTPSLFLIDKYSDNPGCFSFFFFFFRWLCSTFLSFFMMRCVTWGPAPNVHFALLCWLCRIFVLVSVWNSTDTFMT